MMPMSQVPPSHWAALSGYGTPCEASKFLSPPVLVDHDVQIDLQGELDMRFYPEDRLLGPRIGQSLVAGCEKQAQAFLLPPILAHV